MKQDEAIHKISGSLKKDVRVKAVYLKGSVGRGEYDEFSDLDLYCLVDESDEAAFHAQRLMHLEAYRKVIFFEEVYIIAPQIIAVFDNLLHVDLFTVTETNFKEKDYFKVLFDPEERLTQFLPTQNLQLTDEQFEQCSYNVAWYLFQYNKARLRKNDLWAVDMLQQVLTNLSKVLLHRYYPDRAELGLKALTKLLPKNKRNHMETIYNHVTPDSHKKAADYITDLLTQELDWIDSTLKENDQSAHFLKMMIQLLNKPEKEVRNFNISGGNIYDFLSRTP
ncbi:nucleotidyltransferase domain-containing protein [Bacillus sp. V3]|nr:nucleotidyltransferase domain-containing protein [Bacillus sp. V3]